MNPVINLQNLAFAYNGEATLADVSLSVKQGDFLAMIGPNGGGKTTLLKLMLGLLKPLSGTIEVLGDTPQHAMGRIGYVPQHTAVRPGFPITVLETVLMGVKRKNRPLFGHSQQDRDRAIAAVEQVGLVGKEQGRFGDLSGGQMQRALIARALVAEAELLLLDEPTANVDPQGSFCLYDFLRRLGANKQITIVTVSHDLSILGSHVSSIACVNKQLIHNNKPKLTKPMLKMLYGTHEHTCAMDEFMKTMAIQFGESKRAHP